MAPAGGPSSLEHLVQVGGSVGEHVDALVQVAVAGGLRDAGVAGQGGHVDVLAEPAQDQDGLIAGGGGAGADASAAAAAFGDQQIGEQDGGGLGHVERGRVSDHVGSVRMRVVLGRRHHRLGPTPFAVTSWPSH